MNKPFKIPPQSETEIKNAIKDMFQKLGIFYYSAGASMFSRDGVSDLIGCLRHDHGRMFCIEAKKEGWKPPNPGTKQYKHYINQQKFHSEVRAGGGIAFFAQDLDTVIDGLGLRDRFLI